MSSFSLIAPASADTGLICVVRELERATASEPDAVADDEQLQRRPDAGQ